MKLFFALFAATAALLFRVAAASDEAMLRGLVERKLPTAHPNEYCLQCEDYCLECIEVNRCGRNNLRQYCASGRSCGTKTCGSGYYSTRPVACICCADNQIAVRGTTGSGFCMDCPAGQVGNDLTNSCVPAPAPTPTPPPPPSGCRGGCRSSETCCRGACVNLKFDSNNCGSCGRKCRRSEVCDAGRCSSGNFP